MPTDKFVRILQIIRNDKSQEEHFFKKLAVASKPLEWLIPLRDAAYFAPDKNPEPQEVPDKKGQFIVPSWNVLDALENMAVKNEESPSDEVSNALLEVVERIITYRQDGERIGNYGTDWMILRTISHLPIEFIGLQHIEFVRDALNPKIGTSLIDHEIGELFLPKLIKERASDLIIRLLDVILQYRKSEEKYIREYVPVIDLYYLKEALDKNKKGIAELCPIEAAKIGITKMNEILNEDKSQFNLVWIPTIEDHEQTRFADRYECQLVYFVRDMFEAAKPTDIEPIVKNMLSEEHDIFIRLAYHLINSHYGALSHLLWALPYNPLNVLTIHELFELFKAQCKNFDKLQIETILEWIETQKFYFSDKVSGIPEREEYVKAYHKKEWLFALLDTDDEEVKRRYEACNSINDAKLEHPGFPYWSSGVGFVKDVSPVDEGEFKKKSNAEIAAYIQSYKEKEETSFEDFTRVNLASSIRRFVSNDPARFSKELSPFLSVSRQYQHELLMGFKEAWTNNKDFDWDELLPFMKNLIEDGSFWSEGSKNEIYDYNGWIVNTIAALIEEGTRDDKHAFSAELLPIAEQIVLILFRNVKSDMSIMFDLVTSVLNSSKGKVFMAAINYSLRYARLYSGERVDRWIESIKTEFTERLDKTKEPGLEFSTVIGWHLPYLNYLDRQWVASNLNRIFDLESEKHWEAAFTGYIMMTSTVYEQIYKLLRDNGHYEKGLLRSFTDKEAARKLVENIVIGYLAGWDDAAGSNSLLRKLFEIGNIEHISELVAFMWTFRDRTDGEIKSKIKPLWGMAIENIVPNLQKDEYRAVASDLGKWLSLVDTIDDDIYKWLQISVKAMGEGGKEGFFIEYLRTHVMNAPVKVGSLYLKMLDARPYPSYKKEDIIAIVQALYDLNEKEIATSICNTYLSRGFEFLIETFRKNN